MGSAAKHHLSCELEVIRYEAVQVPAQSAMHWATMKLVPSAVTLIPNLMASCRLRTSMRFVLLSKAKSLPHLQDFLVPTYNKCKIVVIAI